MSKNILNDTYPSNDPENNYRGMPLRDYFAGQAIGHLLDNARKMLLRTDEMPSAQNIAHSAYALADAMIQERDK